MATIDATVKGAAANSYVTVAACDTYADGRLNSSDWTGASDADKKAALISAAARLQTEEFAGTPTDYGTPQALAWPRFGAYDVDGFLLDSEAIPEFVARAQMELAIAMLADDLVADSGLEGFASIKVGPIEVEPREDRISGALPAVVQRLLASVLLTRAGGIRLERA